MGLDDARRLLRAMLSPNGLDEIALRIHQVEVDAVVDEVILAWLDTLRGGEVHAVLLAHLLDLLPGARQADDVRVELGQVGSQDGRGVAGRVAGYEDGKEGRG